MKKFLRFSLVALFAVLGMSNAMAEDIIWSEDFSSYSADAVPSVGDYNYVCVDGASATKIYEQALAGGTSPELLVGKKGSGKQGTFTATIPLNGKSGSLTLSYMANYDRIEVTATGATLGDVVNKGNNYVIPVTVESGTESITLTFSNISTSNVRLDDIKLYQGTAKQNPGLRWGKAAASVEFENQDDYDKYLPKLENPYELTLTCTSSDETVATVTNDGTISVHAAGKTTLTASFEGNDDYEAQTVSCELTVTVKKADAELAFSEEEVTVTLDDVFTAPTLTNPHAVEVVYSSSKTEVAEVDATTGEVTIKAAGTTKITAKVPSTNEEYDGSASYMLIVNEAGGDPEEIDETIAGLYSYTAFTPNIKLTINNGKVVYVDGKSVYVRDGEKAILFYDCGLTLPEKATVSGTVSVDLDIFKGLHEVKKNSKTSPDNLTITESLEEAAPVEATFDKLAAKDYTNDLIIIKDQSVIEDDDKWYIQSGETRIQLYKKSANYSSYVSDTKKYDITAIATVYNNNAQLTPISFSVTTGISALTIDTDVNAPMYNLKGERVDANYRGVVIKGGKKTIQK